MALKRWLALFVAITLSIPAFSIPIPYGPRNHFNATASPEVLLKEPAYPLEAPPLVTIPRNVSRMLIFGDSLSDIGNTELLLQTLKGQQYASLIFKPANESSYVRKLLSYFNLSIKYIGKVEDDIGNFVLKALNRFVNVPVYPDDKYYSGPVDDKKFRRFLNGPNWSEWFGLMALHDDVGDKQRFINRAYGGSWATRSKDEKIDWDFAHPDILIQSIENFIDGKLVPPNFHKVVSAFLLEYPKANGGELITALYGGNDYMSNDYLLPVSKEHPRLYPKTVVADIAFEVRRLADWALSAPDGAPATVIYVINLPDMSKTPRFINGTKKGQGEAVKKDILSHNALLRQAVSDLSEQLKYQSRVVFRHIDLFTLVEKNYASLPAKHKTRACYPNNMLKLPGMIQNARNITSDIEPCDDPQDYFFWDIIHPTKRVQAVMSYQICSLIKQDFSDIDCFKPDYTKESSYPRPAYNP